MDNSGPTQARCPPSRSKNISATVSQQCEQSSPPQNRLTPTPEQDLLQQHQQASNTSSEQDGAGTLHQQGQQTSQSHQHAPTPISNVSSPEQILLQQQYRKPSDVSTHQDIASFSHQRILTPRSTVFPLSNNDSPASVFLVPSEAENLITASSIDRTNFPINPLPVLLYSLGCSPIRRDILFRGLLPQKRWDDRGKVHKITTSDAGFDEQITCLFSSQSELEQTIESCVQLGLIVQGMLEDGSLVYSVRDQPRHQISQSFKREELHLLGLRFITHIYPRDQSLEPT